MSIESKKYICTPTDIEHLAVELFTADVASAQGRGTYLKALVGTLQAELGASPRIRSTRGGKLTEDERAEHLKAFEGIHLKFTEAVSKAARAAVDGITPKRLASMTGFARSSSSTLRSYIRAGKDVRSLAAGSVVKRTLAIPRGTRRQTPAVMQRRVMQLQSDMSTVAKGLMHVDAELARSTFAPVLKALAKVLGMDAKPTRSADVAAAEARPWMTKQGMFIPIGLQSETTQ